MADLTIPQIPADAADRDLRPGDDLLANRAGVDIKARVPTNGYAELDAAGKVAADVIPSEAGSHNVRTIINSNDSDIIKMVPVPAGKSLVNFVATGYYTSSGAVVTGSQSNDARFILEYLPDYSGGVAGFQNGQYSSYHEDFYFDRWGGRPNTTGLFRSRVYQQKEFTPTGSNLSNAKIIYVDFRSSWHGFSSGTANTLILDWRFS